MRDVAFGVSERWDDIYGKEVAVALSNDGYLISIYQKSEQGLFIQSGGVYAMSARWSKTGSTYWDPGKNPSIALRNDQHFIEIHEGASVSQLWYGVGYIDVDHAIHRLGKGDYDLGRRPSVAMPHNSSLNIIVEVHVGLATTELWYNIGFFASAATVNWEGARELGIQGDNPSLGLNNQLQGVIAYSSGDFTDRSIYIVAVHVENNTITTGTPQQAVAEGYNPAVVLGDDRTVVLTYDLDDQIYRRFGMLTNNSVNWFDDGKSPAFDRGIKTALAGTAGLETVFQMHNSPTSDDLWYSSSLTIDRKQWMETQYSNLVNKRFDRIVIPGSHDAGAYCLNTKVRSECKGEAPDISNTVIARFATTQNLTIREQLLVGSRFFDIRPAIDRTGEIGEPGIMYAYHDLYGAKIEDVLEQVFTFVDLTSMEFVILKFSHFCKFSKEDHEKLVKLITDKLGKMLYNGKTPIANMTFGEIIGVGKRVYLWYADDYILEFPTQGLNRYLYMFDCYSNTSDVDKMKRDQLDKIKNNSGNEVVLMLLSWTLTTDWKGLLSGDLRDLAAKANSLLGRFLIDHVYASSYNVNILYVDFIQDSRATDCAYTLNLRST